MRDLAVSVGQAANGRTHLRIRSECTNLYFACRDCTIGIDDNGKERILEHLVVELGGHVNSGKPATIAWM